MCLWLAVILFILLACFAPLLFARYNYLLNHVGQKRGADQLSRVILVSIQLYQGNEIEYYSLKGAKTSGRRRKLCIEK